MQSAVSVISAQEPDVVLLDVHLPGGNAQAVLQQSSVDSRFLALSVSDASQDVIGVVRLGARGYVTKDITSADLATAIRQVAAGEAVFSPRLAGFVLDAFTGAAAKTDDEPDRLTQGARRHAPDRARIHLSGSGRGVVPQRQDRGDPHVGGAAQTAVEQPPGTRDGRKAVDSNRA